MLEPGPTRDALGHLSQAARAGHRMTVHDLSARTGVPYTVMRDRLDRLVELGLADVEQREGQGHYAVTNEGRALL